MEKPQNGKPIFDLASTAPRNIGAFFDLDKTILDGATLLLMAPTLYRHGLIKLPTLIRAGIGAKVFEVFGANDNRTKKMMRNCLRIANGWDHKKIVELVEASLEGKFNPRIFAEARGLVRNHIDQGHIVVIVSSSPIELVQPIAQLLGVENVIATRIRLDKDGKCTQEFAVWISGESKHGEISDLAERRGIDLSRSFAYSDSHLDLSMLNAVGHPIAVNPDKKLRLYATANGWAIEDFVKTERVPIARQYEGRNIVSDYRVQAGVGIGVAVATGITSVALSRRFAAARS